MIVSWRSASIHCAEWDRLSCDRLIVTSRGGRANPAARPSAGRNLTPSACSFNQPPRLPLALHLPGVVNLTAPPAGREEVRGVVACHAPRSPRPGIVRSPLSWRLPAGPWPGLAAGARTTVRLTGGREAESAQDLADLGLHPGLLKGEDSVPALHLVCGDQRVFGTVGVQVLP